MRVWLYILRQLLWYLLLFIAGKFFFLFIQFKLDFSLLNFVDVVGNGLALDISATCYILLLPSLCAFLFASKSALPKLLKLYHYILSSIVLLGLVLDALVFKYWGAKLNLAISQYANQTGKGIQSVEPYDLLFALVFFLLLTALLLMWQRKFKLGLRFGWWELLILVPLFIGARGGISKAPIGVSSAFQSQDEILNYASLNPLWNLLSYELNSPTLKAIQLIEPEREQALMDAWKSRNAKEVSQIQWTDSSRIVLIILESFGQKLAELSSSSGESYTPHLDTLRGEGLDYTQAYAASFRSDRGLTALLTGMPSFATQVLSNDPILLGKAPSLIQAFKQAGWYTSMHHGGSLDLGNMRVLFNGIDDLFEASDFKGPSGSWGVHDEFVFNQFAQDVIQRGPRSFQILYSLSSHEPFTVPNYNKHKDPYLNSISYTDSCLGLLINELKEDESWDNSLIIVTADHGSILPERSLGYKKTNYHIPLVLSGGLIKDSLEINEVVSQLDIAPTLASALGKEEHFEFGHSLMNPWGMAFYHYYHGVVVVTDSCTQYYDIPLKKYFGNACLPPYEKAYFQAANRAIFSP